MKCDLCGKNLKGKPAFTCDAADNSRLCAACFAKITNETTSHESEQDLNNSSGFTPLKVRNPKKQALFLSGILLMLILLIPIPKLKIPSVGNILFFVVYPLVGYLLLKAQLQVNCDLHNNELKCRSCGGINSPFQNFCTICGINFKKPSEVGISKIDPGVLVIVMPAFGLLIGIAMALTGSLGIYAFIPVVVLTVAGSLVGLFIAPFIFLKRKSLSYVSITGILICLILLILIYLALKFHDRY